MKKHLLATLMNSWLGLDSKTKKLVLAAAGVISLVTIALVVVVSVVLFQLGQSVVKTVAQTVTTAPVPSMSALESLKYQALTQPPLETLERVQPQLTGCVSTLQKTVMSGDWLHQSPVQVIEALRRACTSQPGTPDSQGK